MIGPDGQPVATLPDGTPSVQIHPRGAKGGDYRVIVGPVCFSVCWGYVTRDCFVLPLCPD